MNKYEAYRSGQFIQFDLLTTATTRTGKQWAIGVITYRRFPYELPIAEDIKVPLESLHQKEGN